MSWFSRAENALLNLWAGKPAQTNVILNPTTPVEQSINAASAVVLPLAAQIPGSSALAVPLTAIKAVVNGVEGNPVSATNAVTASTAIGGVTTTLGTEAAKAVNTFLIDKVGTSNAQMVDAGAESLAAAAITMMSQSKNKTVDDIAAALHGLINSFETPPVAAAA